METELIKINKKKFKELCNDSDILRAAKVIKEGGLVAFPTETVYGLGANALRQEASKKIYAAKGRPSDNPLIVHISEINDVKALVSEIPKNFEVLTEKFWPGPMTLVLKKSDIVPAATSGGLDTVGIRMPESDVARALIKASGVPIAAPSANTSGRPSPTSASHVMEDMKGKIDMILDGGSVKFGLESTIVDLTGDTPTLLRPGAITVEMLKEAIGRIDIDPSIEAGPLSNQPPKAPGMKYKHYAPKGDMEIVRGQEGDVLEYFKSESLRYGKGLAVITVDEHMEWLEIIKDTVNILSLGSIKDIDIIAHNLFNILRKCDDLGVEHILCEGFIEEGLGKAVMNRLKKAAGYKITDL